jgi:hypothetical protein
VREILAVYLSHASIQPELVEPDFYHTVQESDLWSAPFYLSISPGLKMIRGMSVLKIHYWAGYRLGEVPADLAAACMELADWNMKRVKGGKIGVAGVALDAGYPTLKATWGATGDTTLMYRASFAAGALNANGINEACLLNGNTSRVFQFGLRAVFVRGVFLTLCRPSKYSWRRIISR